MESVMYLKVILLIPDLVQQTVDVKLFIQNLSQEELNRSINTSPNVDSSRRYRLLRL